MVSEIYFLLCLIIAIALVLTATDRFIYLNFTTSYIVSNCTYDRVVSWQYHGGTNFGRTAGGPFITTSYDYDAPIDEYGKICTYFFFQYQKIILT